MEEEYLTIPEAMAHTGKSEVTIRRFIRSLRHQYGVELDDTTDQLQEKTLVLRKTKEGKDKNDEPVFQWLIARSSLSSLIDDRRHPVHQDHDEPHEDRHDDPHRDGHEQGINESKTTPDDGLDDIHAVPHDDGREGLDPRYD